MTGDGVFHSESHRNFQPVFAVLPLPVIAPAEGLNLRNCLFSPLSVAAEYKLMQLKFRFLFCFFKLRRSVDFFLVFFVNQLLKVRQFQVSLFFTSQ